MKMPAVLIVEDEALIRMECVEMVKDAGFDAVEASDADAAIRLLETRTDIRAVFTDINMSGSMDGLKLAHAVRGRWPPIHLILTSGRNIPDGGRTLPENARYIPKPYSTEQVAVALWEIFAIRPRQIGGVSGIYRSWRRVLPQRPA